MIKNVLIVEDDAALCRLFQAVLATLDCNVMGVNSVQDAQSQLASVDFDLVLCDIELEDDNALTLVAETAPQRPVVAISSNDHYIRQCRDAGVQAFIVKPVAVQMLVDMVGQLNQQKSFQLLRWQA